MCYPVDINKPSTLPVDNSLICYTGGSFGVVTDSIGGLEMKSMIDSPYDFIGGLPFASLLSSDNACVSIDFSKNGTYVSTTPVMYCQAGGTSPSTTTTTVLGGLTFSNAPSSSMGGLGYVLTFDCVDIEQSK